MGKNNYKQYYNASNDIERILKWYEKLSPGSSLFFLNEFEKTIKEILKRPESYKLETPIVRRCLMKQFPYVLFFNFEKETVTLLRVRGKRQKRLKRYY